MMPAYTDTHCHLAHPRLAEQAAAVLARAREAGVARVVCAAGDLVESAAAAAIAAANADVFRMAGVHPHVAAEAPADYLAQLEGLLAGDKCVAMGEVGLDYHYDFSPRPAQRQVLEAQLDLARRLGKPVVVHTREAFDDTLAIIKASGIDTRRVLFHSFTEWPDNCRRALDLQASVSFSGIVTFDKSHELRQSALLVPDESIMVETDAPYLSPQPVRKMKTNEPANVVHVAACLAALRGVPVQAFAELTTANARRFFGIA